MRIEDNGKMISEWLEKNGEEEIDKFIQVSLNISLKVQEFQKEHEMDVEELAEVFRVSKGTVFSWLSGFANFTIEEIVKIEEVLDIDLLCND